MRKLFALTYIVGGILVVWATCAEAKTIHTYLVTRHARDHYVTAEGRDLYTVGCTSSARLMDAVVIDDGPHSMLYFLDKAGEVEDECSLRMRK